MQAIVCCCRRSLRRKLFQPVCSMTNVARCYQHDIEFSGPAPTELAIGQTRSAKQVFRGTQSPDGVFPREADITIIGGGLAGLCTALFIKHRFPKCLNIVVIEKDPQYTQSSSALSVSGIRHQYSLQEHISMGLFASEFLCDTEDYLGLIGLDPPDVLFNHQGYLLLTSQDEVEHVESDHKAQVDEGANIDLMTQSDLKKKFPWLVADDIELATYGIQKEGWFDPTLLMAAIKAKLGSCDVQFVTGDVVGFGWKMDPVVSADGIAKKRKRLVHVNVRTADERVHPLQFAICVNAAGGNARDVARLAGIGVGDDALAYDLPVMSRNNFIYVLHCPTGPGLDMPMLLDISGFFLRREGFHGNYICSAIPPLAASGVNDHSIDPVEYFNHMIKPLILKRVPSMESMELTSWCVRPMEYNYYDRCPVVGSHPLYDNFLLAAGCTGHGALFAPAMGRALSELILDGEYQTADLSRLVFDRILDDEPLHERLVI